MKVYYLSKQKTQNLNIKPKAPKNTIGGIGDKTTPRISVTPTIEGGLKALQNRIMKGTKLYVYSKEIPPMMLYRPTMKEVPNYNSTGELWIKKPIMMNFEKEITFGENEKRASVDYYKEQIEKQAMTISL